MLQRKPAGTHAGGQFATTARAESTVALGGWSSFAPAVDRDRSAVAREMRGRQSRHASSRDPFLRGTSDGARLAADCLNDGRDRTDTLMRMAREALRDGIDQEVFATSGYGTAHEQDRHADMADLNAGRAHALLFAAHRVAQPDKGADWAEARAREDATVIRRQMNAPAPQGLFSRLRRSLRRRGSRS